MPSRQDDKVARLRSLYKDDQFTDFFEWASDFLNDVSQTTVSRIETQIQRKPGNRQRRSPALDFCDLLQELGLGRLVLGRHNRKTRMEWSYTLRSIGAVARGDTDELEPREEDPDEDEDEAGQPAMSRFEIPLRTGHLKASVEFPENFGDQDVRKIIKFLERLLKS
jgi:hypothetical protein